MFIIPDVLNPDELAQVRELMDQMQWQEGSQTAGAGSNYQKHNLQGDPTHPAVQQGQQLVYQALLRNPRFKILAVPKKVRPITFNRYDEGMEYGDHMDHPILPGEQQIRGDISLTVFISDPADYDGGELVVRSDMADSQTVKLDAGQAVVYSAATLHRVNPVTRGSRLAAVTTAESMIHDEYQRQLIGEVAQLTRWVQDIAPKTPQERRANKIYANLLRLWSET